MSSRSRALFLDLLNDLSPFLDSGTLNLLKDGVDVEPWPDITLLEMQSLALARSFYKKLQDETLPTADTKALEKFLEVNRTSGHWVLSLQNSWEEILFGTFKSVVHDFWNPKGMPLITSFDELFTRGRCGPGASMGTEFHDFYSKLFSSGLSSTNKSLYRAYRCYIANFPEWSIADIIRRDRYGEVDIVEGNRLSFVPKKRDISRTTCKEPIMNMFMQLGMGSHLEGRLRQFFGIDVSTQADVNRDLARIGSLSGAYCTIDLESASDSISLLMLKEVLPADFFSWLVLLRSPTCELPSGGRVGLNMVSTMGNGFTFPLQTMLFSSIVTAAARARGFPLERPRAASDGSFGVFGDDIIVPTNCHYLSRSRDFVNYADMLVRDVLTLLRILGFKVNGSKSFFEGPFRESCGADYFLGQPVRGVYLKTLRTPQSRFVAINLLNRWSAITGIPLIRTIRSLRVSVPNYLVPRWESDDSGIKVPFSMVRKMKLDRDVQSIRYRKYVVRPSTLTILDDGFLEDTGRIYNPSGLLLSFLNGNIRSCKIGLRNKVNVYRSCFGVAPNWDIECYENSTQLPANSDPAAVPAQAGGQRWNTAVVRNLKT